MSVIIPTVESWFEAQLSKYVQNLFLNLIGIYLLKYITY